MPLEGLELKSLCLLIVDAQNAFCHDNGDLARRGLDVRPCKEALINIEKLMIVCRNKRIPIIYTLSEQLPQDRAYVRRTHKIRPEEGTYLHRRWTGTAVPKIGTWDAQIHDDIRPRENDYIVRKQTFDAFYNTNLDLLLRVLGANSIVITGFLTNACVESSLRSAFCRDYDVVVVRDAVGVPLQLQDLQNSTMTNVAMYFGWVTETKSLVDEIESLQGVE